jgi:YggT family protein
MQLIGQGLLFLLSAYLLLLFVRAFLSWIPMFAPSFRPRGVLLALFELIYTITDPPLRLMGRFIPPLRLGTVSLDLGFMVLLVLIMVLQRVVVGIFF